MTEPHVDLTILQTWPTKQVLKLWKEVVGGPPPSCLSREFLVAMVAWHQQAQVFGGLTRQTQAALTRFKKSGPKSKTVPPLPVGTVLLKTYQGIRYTVTVKPDGFVFEGTMYASLSEIARRITGTRWNGPAFFGLRRTSSKQNKKASNE